MNNNLGPEMQAFTKPQATEWRILVDCAPAASGLSDTWLAAHMAAADCAMRMFTEESDDAMVQVRTVGAHIWQTVDAAWGRGQ